MVEVRVLGPVEASGRDGPVHVGGRRQRRLLALLAARAPQACSVDRLAEDLWPDDERPANAVATLRTYVSRLRTALDDADAVVTTQDGYRVNLEAGTIDTVRFEELVRQAERHGEVNPALAADILGEALALWRGPAFGEFADEDALSAAAKHLEELRLVAVERRLDALLDVGAHAAVTAELEGLVTEHPLRERFHGQLMLALHRSGRTAEASFVYQDYRSRLIEQAGVEPSPELSELQSLILSGDPRVDAPARGSSLRGYQLGEKIGEGAFGQIFRATQPAVGREVAIKVVRPGLADDPDFIRRFEYEAQLVARLEHPHIVPLYDYWREPGGAYLVMRWIRGGAVGTGEDGEPWPLERVVRLVEQVGGALAAAHDAGVVHRDVKPGNILIDERDNAYLTDFGIAFEVNSDVPVYGLTSAGSPVYRSPELYGSIDGASADARVPTPRSDLYSLALVATELLIGRPPFTTTSPELLHREKLEHRVRCLVGSLEGLPEDAVAELERAASPDPDDRHESVDDFVSSLVLAVERSTSERASPTAPTSSGSAPATPLADVSNPYKGLRAFVEADADDFFGRDLLVEELLAVLETKRLVAVVGPSGSGKSSVVRAGVVPALRRGELPGSERWFTSTIVPGANPLEELESALLRVAIDPPSRLIDQLRTDARGLVRVVDQILPDDGSQLVLVVDQFEELFTLADPESRATFLTVLAAAITTPQSRVRVIATLRADFYDRPLQEPHIGPLVRAGTVPVVPLAGDELQRAIVGPASRVGVALEEGLFADLIAEVVEQPGSLPLLQYALTELFERRADGVMTLDAYRDLGGVAGALAGRAEAIYLNLDSSGQDAARQLFGRLITPGEGAEDTRRRARQSELRSVLRGVVEEYARARLLSFDRDEASREPTIEVAHEALIREWPRLRDWVQHDREALRILRHVDEAARAWDAGGRDGGDLYRGARLEAALEWADSDRYSLATVEEAFLSESRRARDEELTAEEQRIADQARQNQRLRRMLVIIGVALVAAVLGGVFAFQQSRRADTEAAEAQAARSAAETRRLAADAAQLVGTNRRVALLLAAEAFRRDPSAASLGALQRVLVGTENFLAYVGGTQDWRDIAFVDNQTLIGVTAEGATLIDVGSGSPVAQIPIPGAEVIEVASDQGTAAIAAGEVVRLVRVPSGALFGDSLRHETAVRSLAFSPDGTVLATGDRNGTISLFDVASGRLAREFVAHPERGVDEVRGIPEDVSVGVTHQPETVPVGVTSLAFNEDGSRLVSSGLVNVRLWDVTSAELLADVIVDRPTYTSGGRSVTPPIDADLPAASPGLIRVATAFGFLYLDADGSRVDEVVIESRTRTAGFSTIESAVALGEGVVVLGFVPGGRATVYSAGSSVEIFGFDTLLTGSPSVALSPDEGTVAYGAEDGIVLWALDGRRLIADAVPAAGGFAQANFSPDGSRLLLTGANRPISAWNLATGEPSRLHFRPDSDIGFVFWGGRSSAFSMDSETQLIEGIDPETLEPTGVSYGHSTSVVGAGSPDEKMIAIGTGGTRLDDDPPVVRVFDVETGTIVVELSDLVPLAGDGGIVSSVGFSSDGKQFVAASGNGAAVVWDTETWLPSGPRLSGGAGSIVKAQFSPDGRWLVTIADDGTITLRDPVTFQPDGPPLVGGTQGNAGFNNGPYFTEDGQYLLTGADGKGRLFDLSERVQIGGVFPGGASGASPAATRDGSRLATFEGAYALVWNTEVDGWFDTACRVAGRSLTLDEWRQFGPTGEPYRATCPQWPGPGDPATQPEGGSNG